MAKKIPLEELNHYSFDFELDGIIYELEFKKNTSDSLYRLSIFSNSSEELVSGVPVVPEIDLLAPYRKKIKLSGILIAFVEANGLESYGGINLYYV